MQIDLGDVRIRTWREEDAASLRQHADSPAVWRAMTDDFPRPYTEEDARAFLSVRLVDERPTQFALADARGAFGAIGLHPGSTSMRTRMATIGYWLGEAYWGRGIATRAVRALTRWGFECLDVVRIEASVFAWNAASARVLEKAGFSREAVLRRRIVKAGEVLDELLYVRFREELDAESG